MDRVKRIWYLSPLRAAKVQASLCICAVSPELSLLTHTSSESRGTFRQKARSLAPLNGWACAVKICHDGMLEDTNSLDGAQIVKILTKHPLNWRVNILNSLFYSTIIVSNGYRIKGQQCAHWSDCSFRSSLVWVCSLLMPTCPKT